MLEDRRLMSAVPAFEYSEEFWFQANVLTVDTPTVQSVPIQFSLTNAPKGTTIDAKTGAIRWTPTESQVGHYSLTVAGKTATGTTDATLAFQVEADIPSLRYLLNSSGNQEGNPYGVVGKPMTVYVINQAATEGKLTIVSGPKNATLSSAGANGVINWTPEPGDVGTANFRVQSKNPYGTTQLKIQFPVYPVSPVTDISVKTNGLTAPTMSWTPPTPTSGEAITGYNIRLQVFGPSGVTNYAFDRSSAASSFQLHGLPKGDYDIIPTVTPLNAQGRAGVSTSGPAFAYGGSSPLIVPAAAAIFTGQSLDASLGEVYTGGVIPAYSLISGPKGLTIDQTSGQIRWTPASNQTGNFTVSFSAQSTIGTFTGSMTISVTAPVPGQPTNVSISNATSTGFDVSWCTPATYANLVAGYNVCVDYAPNDSGNESDKILYTVPADSLKFVFTAPVLGAFSVQVIAFDASGNRGASSGWFGAGTSW